MLQANDFINLLIQNNLVKISGVPCSYFNSLIEGISQKEDITYIPASNEGEALSIISGNWIVNKEIGIVLSQNSGFGNMINPLTSLNYIFKIPVLLFITYRGQKGLNDEPQHEQMGEMLYDLLKLLKIDYEILPKDITKVEKSIEKNLRIIKKNKKVFAYIVEKETFNKHSSKQKPSEYPSRIDVLKALTKNIPKQSPIIATTGKTGRELYSLNNRKNNFYCVGSMGYVNAIANGISLSFSKETIFILDGDGAALMHLGNLSTIGSVSSKNLVHIILDNGTYDSTGGQKTLSENVDFLKISEAMNYQKSFKCSSINEVLQCLQDVQEGPILIHIKIKPGSIKNLGRPKELPQDILECFHKNINSQG